MIEKDIYELTNPQKSIWMSEQYYKGTNINNIVGYVKIEKNANIPALEKAFNILVQKNDSFKTKICIDNSIPKQYFDDFVYENIEIIELKDDSQLLQFETSFPMQVIDTDNGFLFLPKILSFPDGSAIMALIAHHLIADAWTISLILEEFYQIYLNIVNNEEVDLTPAPSYIEFIKSQDQYMASDKFQNDKNYWQEQFANLPNMINFKNNTKTSISADRKIFTFNKTTADKITAFCQENKISDYIFLLSIFNIYFFNIFNTNNFVIGNPVLNRSNFREKQIAGMFVSIMPFIVNIDKSASFTDFCQELANNQKQMYRHIKYPYHAILNYVRKQHNFLDSLYDIVFSYQNSPVPSYCKWLPNHSQAESLQIHIKNISEEKNNLSIHYDYLTDIFSEEEIDIMHERILNLVNQVIKFPTSPISSFEIISKNETKKLLKEFNNTSVEYDKNSTIVKEFEKIVKKYPNNIAVKDNHMSYTYDELNKRANVLAHKILEQKVTSEIIAFSLKRSVDIVVTILAILKSGHTYMPIDPEYPTERINFMLENSETKILITNEDFYKNLNYNGNCILYNELNLASKKNSKNLGLEISPEKLCYIMYTSGSTGTPKAVSIKHYNVLNFVKSMHKKLDYTPSANNNVLSVTTVCFDIFVFELYPTLLAGLTLVIADELESRTPKLLSDTISRHKISKILTTPSRIELLFSDAKCLKSLTNVKELILGGEPLSYILLNKLRTHTKSKLYNLYGPTETTVYSTFKDVTNCESITIGKPINNTQIYILNDNNKIQPIGLVGEICIGGDGVGSGYYKNKEKTKLAFIKNPYGTGTIYKTGDLGYWRHDGELVCLGRKDYQVKIRGYRIELDDISNNILNFDSIEKCVVVDKTDSNGKKYLCAYFVSSKKIDIDELKKYLVDILPHYMIPSYLVQLDKLPLTINHKVDRNALPDPSISNFKEASTYTEPQTKVEKDLCTIFKKCLSLNKIGTENDIFEYPIDSLDIIKVQTIMLKYNYKLNTQDFYKFRTIKKLAQEIETKNMQQISQEEMNYLSTINQSFYKYPYLMQFSKKHYNNVLLLGSTGYLGIHLLNQLLVNTKCNITCIIRRKNNIDSQQRLIELYNFYFHKKLPLDRITIINSNITKPQFGLSNTRYNKLRDSIDICLNAAANVRYYGDYQRFKEINIDVVQNLIDFCAGTNIQLVHISTLGVAGNYLVNHQRKNSDFGENDFYIGQEFKENVYIQTKFEAEKLIYENAKNNLNVSIIRVGNLTSRYKDGAFQKNFEENAFYSILMLILKYHVIPNTILNNFLEFTPIDYCSNAIIKLIFNVEINKHVFHLFNSNYIHISELLKIFEELGYSTEILTGSEFKKKILNLSNMYQEEAILKGVINNLDDEEGILLNSTINQKNDNTNSCLEKLNFEWPNITEEYIEKIVKYLRSKKLLN